MPPSIIRKAKDLKMCKNPVCIGFGVSTPEQVRWLKEYFDGVIVGSAIMNKVSRVQKLTNTAMKKEIERFVKWLNR